MGAWDWIKSGGYKGNSPFNVVGQGADWVSTWNDPPPPGYDSQGNAIVGSSPYNGNPYNIAGDHVGYGDNGVRPPANPSSDPFAIDGPEVGWLDSLMQGLMNNKGNSGNAEGAAAAAAFNPVFASLAAEKASAKRRGKANQKDIKGAYRALRADYIDQAKAEVKGHAKATKEQNKAFSKDVYETGEAYTKIKAESDSEAARLGQTGTSAQQIADQKIGMASAGAVDLVKYQNTMNKAASDQTSKSQENYMRRGAPIATQAGAEQVTLSQNKLEDVLLGLNKEEAQAKLQQAAARMAAKNAAYSPGGPDISKILAISGERRAIQNDWIKQQTDANPSLDPTKLKGLISANAWATAAGVDSGAMEKFMQAYQADADINNGTYEDPDVKGKQVNMTADMKRSKIYTLAVQAGISTAKARQMAEIYTRG